MRILVVEDDPDLARQLKAALGDAGYAVDYAPDGEEAHFLGETEPYNAIVLDLGLPKMDGVSVLERWRRASVTTPVLILTARGAWSEKVAGFDAGADDYLTKPFALEELLARVRALARRPADVVDHDVLTVGDLSLDVARRDVRRGSNSVELTAKEFDLLQYLMRNAGRVLSRSQIMDHVWGYDAEPSSNVVDIYVHYLRDKIDKDSPRPLIRTIRGVGYTIKE